MQGRGMWERPRGETKKYEEKKKKKSQIREARTGRKRGMRGGPRNSLGSLPSGLVLACSCPFTTFSFFRAFFFFFFSYYRFKHSFEQGMAAAMFFLERVYTYRLVCVQATFACSDRKREKERRETAIKGGTQQKRQKNNTKIMRSVQIGSLPRDEPQNEGRKKETFYLALRTSNFILILILIWPLIAQRVR